MLYTSKNVHKHDRLFATGQMCTNPSTVTNFYGFGFSFVCNTDFKGDKKSFRALGSIEKYLHTILYFEITYKYIVIKKKETQRLALYQGSPEEKNIKSFKVTIQN